MRQAVSQKSHGQQNEEREGERTTIRHIENLGNMQTNASMVEPQYVC